MRNFIGTLLLCLLPLAGGAQEVPAVISYHEYLSQVLSYYPLLKKEQASVERAIAAKAVVAASRMPHFWASVGADYGNDPVYVFGTLLRQNRFSSSDFDLDHLNTPKSRRDNSLSLDGEWVLFDFFQTTERVKSAGFLAESARYQSELTIMEAILAASELYDRLTVTDELLFMVDHQARSGRGDVDAMEALGRRGLALGADYYLARMTLSRIESIHNELLSQRDALSMAFNIIRGADPATPVTTEPLPELDITLTGSVDDYIGKALAGRLDVKSMQQLLEAGSQNVSVEKNGLTPKIVAYGSASRHSPGSLNGGGDAYGVGVKAKFDLNPAQGARVKLAKAEETRLTAQLQETKDRAARDMAEMYYRLKAMGTNIVLVRRDSTDAEQAVRLLEPLYREGRRSVAEMLSARMAQVAATERRLKMEAARRLSQLSLEMLTGELTPDKAGEIYGQ